MTETRQEWVARMIETWNAGRFDDFLDELGPEFEFTPDPSFPDADTYSGDQWRSWMLDWTRTWGENRLEILGISEHGDAALVESRWHLTSKEGAEVPISDFNVIVWFDEGPQPHALRGAAFFDRDRALAEADASTG